MKASNVTWRKSAIISEPFERVTSGAQWAEDRARAVVRRQRRTVCHSLTLHTHTYTHAHTQTNTHTENTVVQDRRENKGLNIYFSHSIFYLIKSIN